MWILLIMLILQLNEKLNEMVANHQNIISEKDKQLAEYQKQIEGLQRAEVNFRSRLMSKKRKIMWVNFFKFLKTKIPVCPVPKLNPLDINTTYLIFLYM